MNRRAGCRTGPREVAYPDSLKGGLGTAGDAALHDFVNAGGTLITFNDASRWAIEYLKLPVKDVLAGVEREGLLRARIAVRGEHGPVASAESLDARASGGVVRGWSQRSRSPTARARRRRPCTRPPSSALLSGWLLGGEKLRGRAALVDVKEGKGHVVLFGYRPQYRAQSMAMYPQLWAALLGWQ